MQCGCNVAGGAGGRVLRDGAAGYAGYRVSGLGLGLGFGFRVWV